MERNKHTGYRSKREMWVTIACTLFASCIVGFPIMFLGISFTRHIVWSLVIGGLACFGSFAWHHWGRNRFSLSSDKEAEFTA